MKRISRAAAERAYNLAVGLHASRGAKVDGNDVARVAREAGIAPAQVWRALATVRQEKSRGARGKWHPGTRGAETLVAVLGAVATLVFGAASVATIRDGLRLLADSEYLSAVLVLGMGAGMLVITANVAYQAVGAVRERTKSRG